MREAVSPSPRKTHGTGLGYAVVAGIQVPITEIVLRDSKVWFLATVRGPVPAASGPCTIFGDDDAGICQGGGDVRWSALGPDAQLLLWIKITMDQCE